jgi:hypothetical protein
MMIYDWAGAYQVLVLPSLRIMVSEPGTMVTTCPEGLVNVQWKV